MWKHNLVSRLQKLVGTISTQIEGTEWYLFGSALVDPRAADIDLLVICKDDVTADLVRRTVDLDALPKLIHLSLLTELENREIEFTTNQGCIKIFETVSN
jgi:hypothetical protein